MELYAARTARGVSRDELAVRAGLPVAAVADIENGRAADRVAGPLFSALALAGFAHSGRRPAHLDDPALIASQRAMTMSERLEAGFELCEFASRFVGSARR
jgi:transcriptional regulator with XRE-family HTH domain